MMPGLDGIEVCRRLRAEGEVAILMLTARDGTSDRVQGLDGGADDYLVKPFAYQELMGRGGAGGTGGAPPPPGSRACPSPCSASPAASSPATSCWKASGASTRRPPAT